MPGHRLLGCLASSPRSACFPPSTTNQGDGMGGVWGLLESYEMRAPGKTNTMLKVMLLGLRKNFCSKLRSPASFA